MLKYNLLNEKIYIDEIVKYLNEKTNVEYEIIKDKTNNLVIVNKQLKVKELRVTAIEENQDWLLECYDLNGNDVYDEVAVFLWGFEYYQDENSKDYLNAAGCCNGIVCLNEKLEIGSYPTHEDIYEIIDKRI